MTEEEMIVSLNKSSTHGRPKLTKTGKILLGIAGASFVTVCAVATPFLLPAARRICLPYVPATTEQVSNVMKLLHGRSGAVVDLGSGDGRIVIEAAKRGFHAEGVELNPWLVTYSRYRSLREGTSRSTRFRTCNLWKHDLSSYNNIVIFGVDSMMNQLQQKLAEEMSTDARVIACRFPFESCTPTETVGDGLDSVWLYTRSDIRQSTASRLKESSV